MAHTSHGSALAALLAAALISTGRSARVGEPTTSSEEPQASQRRGENQCREKSVNDVCECNSRNKLGQYQCSGCKDKKKWGYGCGLDCPEHCPWGCDFSGNCLVPTTCKRNGRVDNPTTEVINIAGECQACDNGYYGLYCTNPCPKNCKKSDVEGVCTRGGKCYICEEGWYGDSCEFECPKACPLCAMRDNLHPVGGDESSGEFLPAGSCLTECTQDMWGETCEKPCPQNCKDSRIPSCLKHNGTCMKCQGHNWYGEECDEECEEGCIDKMCQKHDGVCEKGCKPSYYGPMCDRHCNGECGGDKSCHRESGVCLKGCKPGFWGITCGARCPSGMAEGVGCDQETALPEACEEGKYPSLNYGGDGFGKCFDCPNTCVDGKCNKDGTCTNGCEEGFYGKKCEHLCAPKCDGPCDTAATGLSDGYCGKCIPGFTGKRCTKRCHGSCAACNKNNNAITENDCTACQPDEPTELKNGVCECIPHSTLNSSALPYAKCICEEPTDPQKKSFFEKEPVKRCRWICKSGLMEVYGKGKLGGKSTCLTKEVYNAVLGQDGNDLKQGSCSAGEYEFTMKDGQTKTCIAKEYVENILAED